MRGDVLVQAALSAREALRPGMHVVVPAAKGRPALEAEILRVSPHRVGAVVRLEGVADRDAAILLAGRDLAASRGALPQARRGEFYVCDVVGASAYSAAGELLGIVEEIITTGANDVWVVRDRGRELLVPAVAHAVLEVDLARGRVVIDTTSATRSDDREEP